ncbi:VOC family protein [Ornithinibacillus scapharcae]|uniref:VOC family protein n=1 Tax=Ornithinibacillus scapharcae TaxID=1147159 RepID=UPI000225AABF|nr:VOC family protein [Ornithinibacillus scapharcae]
MSNIIITHLWFNNQAEEAARFYISVFPNSKINRITRYGNKMVGNLEGEVMTVEFELDGRKFVAFNGGPKYKFTEAISLIVNCETQEEIDYYWEKLSEGGDESAQAIGWLKDKFGVSWQVIPTTLTDMMSDKDSSKVERVLKELRLMKTKLDLNKLQKAYDG